MGQEERRAAVAALVRLAESGDYRDRADAARAMSSFADVPGAGSTLLRLVLDAGDTFVTRMTAEALLRRHDEAGLAIVAEALVAADFQHSSHIQDAVVDVFGIFARDRDDAIRRCEAMAMDPNEQVRQGAGVLVELLNKISPVLYPEQDR